jgi:hypothetical protein
MNKEILYKLIELNQTNFRIPTDHIIEHFILAEDYQCMLQYHLPLNAKQCSHCDSLICKQCLNYLQIKDGRCPSCRKELISKEPNRLVKITLAKFILRCVNPECSAKVKYENFIEHYLNCDYTPREAICTGCDSIVKTTNQLKEINEHNRNCNLQEACRFCNKIMLFKDLISHMVQCEEREIICPYCGDVFAFSKTTQHWSKMCALKVIKERDNKLMRLMSSIKQKDEIVAQMEMFMRNSAGRHPDNYLNNLINDYKNVN